MNIYTTKYGRLSGTSSSEVMREARKIYHTIQKQTKRLPYVRSSYFRKDKIFLNTFWSHLTQKRRADQTRRLKFYACAIDLLRNTTYDPSTILSNSSPGEMLHRFTGKTKNGEIFYVQVKQVKKSGRKEFMSVFPAEK